MKTTYVAIAPDGSEHTRTSSRTYTHAVLCYGTCWDSPEPSWGHLAFSGREDLAVREANRWHGRFDRVIVVPVIPT